MTIRSKYILLFLVFLLTPLPPVIASSFINTFASTELQSIWHYIIIILSALSSLGIFLTNFWYSETLGIKLFSKMVISIFALPGFLFLMGYNKSIVGVWKLLTRSFSIYFFNFKYLIAISSFTMLPIIFWLISINIPGLNPLVLLVTYIMVLFLVPLTYLWCSVGIIEQLYSICSNQPFSLKYIYKNCFAKFLPFTWITLLVFIFILTGTLLFFIPGIIVFIWFIFAPVVFIAKDIKGTSALSESHQLASSNWWVLFWRIAVYYLLILIIFYLVTEIVISLFGLISGQWEPLLIYQAIEKGSQLASYVNILVPGIMKALFMPFIFMPMVILYVELKKIKSAVPAIEE